MSKTAQSVWNSCLAFIKDNITPQAYKTWFEPIQAVKLTDCALSIQVPSKFFYEWLEEHYVKLLKVSLTKELGKRQNLSMLSRWKTHMATNSLLQKRSRVHNAAIWHPRKWMFL
jgi:chromosomal replication initiation ATPase DnaA